MPLEILNFLLVLLGSFFRPESAEIAPFASAWVLLARIEPIFAGGELADHAAIIAGGLAGFLTDAVEKKFGKAARRSAVIAARRLLVMVSLGTPHMVARAFRAFGAHG